MENERRLAARRPSAGWIVWGILLLYFPLMSIIGAIATLSTEDGGLPVAIIIFFVGALLSLPSIALFAKRSKLVKAHKTRLAEFERHEEYAYAQTQTIVDTINALDYEIYDYSSKTRKYVEFLAPTYDNLTAALFLLICIRDGRADTLKEAKNLYEMQVHNWKLEKVFGNPKKMQEIHNIYISGALQDITNNQYKMSRIIPTMQ